MSLKQVHLLCSSGGVRCYSYIGAYKALLKAGYTVSGVSASSMGSVVGMLFCMGLSPEQVEEKILTYPIKNIYAGGSCINILPFSVIPLLFISLWIMRRC
ncbi:patatin-like phospholipase family protein [Paraflavitalea speifideaquila]|uniref:patatin-like phospholipase family protein n=1 Tax=Paraflavitalea speifideaquila TaxID=3076558 RepID=UPI003312FD89